MFSYIKNYVPVISSYFSNRNDTSNEDMMAGEKVTVEEHVSKYNSIVDGINRLGRPLMLFGVIAFFAWAISDPVYFSEVMKALATTPEFVATAILTALGIFGAGRIVNDIRQPTYSPRRTVVKKTEVVNTETGEDEIDPALFRDIDTPNASIDEWKNRNAN